MTGRLKARLGELLAERFGRPEQRALAHTLADVGRKTDYGMLSRQQLLAIDRLFASWKAKQASERGKPDHIRAYVNILRDCAGLPEIEWERS